MGLLDHFDIALLMDTRTEIGGDVTTLDSSRHGIHAVLGDGSTVATFPTWDEERGLYTFDGTDDFMHTAGADGAGILDTMGGVPETHLEGETYLFYFSPFSLGAVGQHCWLCKNPQPTQSIQLLLQRGIGSNQLSLTWRDGFGNIETFTTPIDSLLPFDGRDVMFSIVRRRNVQELWVFDNLLYSGTDTSEDARDAGSMVCIGRQEIAGWYMPAGTGLRCFAYAQEALVQSQLRQLRYGHRSLL